MADVLERLMAIYFRRRGYLVEQGYPVPVQTTQLHVRSVDLVAVRLVGTPNPLGLPDALACEVKSFFGSHGVRFNDVTTVRGKGYPVVNDPVFRQQVLAQLKSEFGRQFEVAVVGGKFYNRTRFFGSSDIGYQKIAAQGAVGPFWVIDAVPCMDSLIEEVRNQGNAYSEDELVQLLRILVLTGRLKKVTT